jgi:hypothetical protein
MRRDRIRPPDDDELGAVADLAEARRARAERLIGEAGGARARGVEHRPSRLGERHRPALRLTAGLPQAVDERRPRTAEDRCRGVCGLLQRDRAALDPRDRRPVGGDALGEPCVAELACPRQALQPALGDRRLDVVAGASASGACRVSHRP